MDKSLKNFIYKKETISNVFLPLGKLYMKVIMPIAFFFSGLFKSDSDDIRRFYISLNNIFVQSDAGKYTPDEILVLLPHCLQNSNCEIKITNDINNCKKCGKCNIGDIFKIVGNKGVDTVVVTGGTAARSITKKKKPKIILSIACERELSSGIVDIRGIPVIGIVNQRPNGPCFNTIVDVGVFEQKLENLITGGKKVDR